MTKRLSRAAIWILAIGVGLIAAGRAHAQSLDISGQCRADLLETARGFFHRTAFEEADERFAAYLAECPESALAHAYVAIVDNLLYRDNADAVRRAEDMAANSPGDASVMAGALTHFAKGELVQAESVLLAFAEDYPDDVHARHVLGFTLVDQGRADEGQIVLEQLVEERPDYYPAYNHLAYALLTEGQSDAALSTVDAFVEADPGNASAWDTRAHILWETGNREEAVASLARAIVLDERFAYGLRHMGDMLLESGDAAAAAAAWERARSAGALASYGEAFEGSLDKRLAELNE